MGVYRTEFANATDGRSTRAERSRSSCRRRRLPHSLAEDMNHSREMDLLSFQNHQLVRLVWSWKARQRIGSEAFALCCAGQASRTRVHNRACRLILARTQLLRTRFIRSTPACLSKTLHSERSQTSGGRALHVRCAAGASGQAGILDWLRRELNEEQFGAVTAPTDIPVLVMAGPGSGKTRVLTFRMAYLIAQGLVDPSRLLAVTFTNKAAEEMKERVMGLLTTIQCSLDNNARHGPLVGTIHSACVRILYLYGAARDIPSDFIIYTDLESKRVIRDLLLARNSEVPMDKKIAQLNSLLSELKNEAFCAECGDASTLSDPVFSSSAGLTMDLIREARELLPDYQQRLKRAGALDFDDLILEAGRLLRDHPSIRSELQRRWEYLLVDETQDTSRAQYHVLRLLAERERGGEKLFPLFLVGDPDQSIYGWRGADTSAIRRFRDSLPRTRVYLLETNYRSTESVARFAQFIIEQDQMRVEPGKRMRTVQGLDKPVRVVHCENPKAEAEFVIQQARSLMEKHNLSGQDIAIMYRTNALSREFEEACIRAGVPYALIGGLPFYERREIKDILACLKLLHNEDDVESFKRVLGFAVAGIGPRTTETFLQWAQTQQCSAFAALRLLRELDECQATSVPGASERKVNSKAKTEPTRGDDTAFAMVAATESMAGSNTPSDQNATIPIRLDKRRLLLSFLQMFEEWKRLLESSVNHERRGSSILAHVIERILEDTHYEQHLRKLAPHGRSADEEASTIVVQERLENIHELVRAASVAEENWQKSGDQLAWHALAAFLREVALVRGMTNEEKNSENGRRCIGLMTLHASKGLEFEAVFVVGLLDGVLPHKLSLSRDTGIAEERRLAYVAFTRAKRLLIMTWYQNGKQSLSRFIRDVPDSLLSRHRANDLLNGNEKPIPRSQYLTGRLRNIKQRSKSTAPGLKTDTMIRRSPRSSLGEGSQASSSRGTYQNLCPGMVVQHINYGKGVVLKKMSNSSLVVVRFFERSKSWAVPGWQLERTS